MNYSLDSSEIVQLNDEAKCFRMRILAIYCIVIFFSSIACNSALLTVFYFHKQLRTLYNVFIIALTIINLITTVTTLPLVIISNLHCRWIYGQLGCTVNGFMMFWSGSANIYLLTALSYGRYKSVANQMMGVVTSDDLRHCLLTIAVCALFASIWAFFPLFGWSYYSLEGLGTSCSVAWTERSVNVLTYNIAILFGVFLIPIFLIVIINMKIFRVIKEFYKNQTAYMNMVSLKRKIAVESGLFFITISLIVCLTITWLPYAIFSFYKIIYHNTGIDPFWGAIPAMFAKSSLLWNAILFMIMNKRLKKNCLALFKINVPNRHQFELKNIRN